MGVFRFRPKSQFHDPAAPTPEATATDGASDDTGAWVSSPPSESIFGHSCRPTETLPHRWLEYCSGGKACPDWDYHNQELARKAAEPSTDCGFAAYLRSTT